VDFSPPGRQPPTKSAPAGLRFGLFRTFSEDEQRELLYQDHEAMSDGAANLLITIALDQHPNGTATSTDSSNFAGRRSNDNIKRLID
jgi:hypothetical protein